MSAKFELRSFKCVRSRQWSSVTIQNRWTQVCGTEIDRRQSLIYMPSWYRPLDETLNPIVQYLCFS